MIYRIEVGYKKNILDALGESVNKDIHDLGIKQVSKVKSVQIYKLDAGFNFSQADELCRKLLIDPITQEYLINQPLEQECEQRSILVEVWFKKGVTDAVGDTVITGARDLNIQGAINSVHTGIKYVLYSQKLTHQQAETIARKLLSNAIVQDYYINQDRPA